MDERSRRGAEILARHDRIPVWPYPRRLLWIIGAGYFFAFFDVVTIGLALPAISKQFDVSTDAAAIAITTSLIGYIVGAFLIGNVADRFGRRLGLFLSVGAFTIGSVLSAFAPDMIFLDVVRFITGVGIGAEIAVVTSYVGELAPSSVRGRIVSSAGVFAYAGLAVVPFVARVLVPNYEWGWRAMFVVGGLGGLTIFLLRIRGNIPATPHRCVASGDLDAAESVVAAEELRANEITGKELPPPIAERAELPGEKFPTRVLLRAPYLRRLVVLVTMWFIYYVGNYGWLTIVPSLLVEQGYSLSKSLSFLMVTSIGLVVGAVAGRPITDRIERKNLASGTAIIWAAALAIIGLAPSGATIMLFGFLASCTIGLIVPVLYTYTAENFPTSGRSSGIALTDGLGHVGGALAPVFVLGANSVWGFEGAFLLMAATGLATAGILFGGIRTRGVPLSNTADFA